jgi:prevent-host-death family protein
MYSLYISELTVSEAREHLADAVERARSGEPVYVTRRGRRVVVIVDAEAYDSLVTSVEDAIDRAELRAARDDDDYVPWEDVKAISA